MTTPLFVGSDWSRELLARVTEEISRICDEELKLDCFPMHICTITAEQMLDTYASGGVPVYAHWSYGKQFFLNRRLYEQGGMGLAYELVINSDPCIVYCMEGNSMTMQTLVIAHAGFGHNHFFKNNHSFKQWTDPSSVVDYLKFSRDLVTQYEGEHGIGAVQDFLSACHAWSHYGIDKYKHPRPLSVLEEKERMRVRAAQVQENLNVIWRIIPATPDVVGEEEKEEEDKVFPSEPQENILYFIEKNAPSLPPWKRELIRIARKKAQYFYPQMLTKLMNEGFATFVHHHVMTRLWEKGLLTEASYQEFLVSHTNIAFQPGFDERRHVVSGHDKDGRPIVREKPIYNGVNPYALGFALFTDIKRMCENPTEEDRKWFPHLAGAPWLEAVKWAAENFTDKTFVEQYLSPKVIRDFKFFSLRNDDEEDEIVVSAIHDDDGYRDIRNTLAQRSNLGADIPVVQVTDVDRRGDRTLTLVHDVHMRQRLDAHDTEASLALLYQLWGYPVALSSIDEEGHILDTWECLDGEDVEHSDGLKEL